MALDTTLLDQYFEGKRRQSPVHSLRASRLGDPCERKLCYDLLAWEKASLPPVHLQKIFEQGHLEERAGVEVLQRAGYLIERQQAASIWRAYNLTGHVDFTISQDGGKTWHLAEFKGLHPYYYDSINEWRDFLKSPIYSRYPAQGQIYCLLDEVEEIWFIIKRKGALDFKMFPMALDYDYAEALIQKAERVNRAVAKVKPGNGSVNLQHPALPEKINSPDECPRCSYRHLCMPDIRAGASGGIVADEELEELLEVRERTAPAKQEYEAADKRLKEYCKTRKEPFICGNYYIEPKELVVHYKAQPAKPARDVVQHRVKITKIEEEREGEAA